jgi:hypothetical protein
MVAFCLYLFRDIIVAGHNLFGDDFVLFYMGMKKFLYDEIQIHHEIPYWNPYIFGGMPFWAHFESTIFYPLGFLFWLLEPVRAYGLTMFVHLALAGIFMFLLAKSFGISRFGAFAAGAIFACNGFVMAILFLGHLSPVESYVWLPVVLYFLNRVVRSESALPSAVLAGAFWGVQILAGAPQDAFYTFLASMLFLACSIHFGRAMKRQLMKLLVAGALLFVVGVGLSSVQIIPAFELISESVRASLDSYEMVTMASYPPQGVITALMPWFFGNYADGTVWVANMPWSIPQQNLYTGILPIMLLFFLSLRSPAQRRVIIFAGILAILSFTLALGRHTPIYKAVFLLPGFDRFRAPSKILVLYVFSMALLAGFGLNRLLAASQKSLTKRMIPLTILVTAILIVLLVFQYHRSAVLDFFSPLILDDAIPAKMMGAVEIIIAELRRLTLFSLIALLLFLLMIRKTLNFRIGAVFLCALLLVDLSSVHEKAIRQGDSTYKEIEGIKHDLENTLSKDKSHYRLGVFTHRFGPNLEMYLGYQTVGGCTALFPSRYYEYIDRYANYGLPRAWISFSYGVAKDHVMMDLLNVKYEISHDQKFIGFSDTVLPRAFIVPSAEVVAKEEILDRLTSPDFDPLKTVLIEEESKVPVRSTEGPYTKARVDIIDYAPDSILLNAESPSTGYLFLSEIFYPGWKAYVDDRPATILRGNYLFRVIPIPAGRHQIRLHFDPPTIKLGIGVSVLTLLVILGTLVYFFRRRRIPTER